MPGRKQTPTQLKLLRGNPGRRPLNQNEPQPPTERPEPPSYLKGEGLREWSRMSKVLHKMGVLSTVDRAVFAAYCVAYGRFVRAYKACESFGYTQVINGVTKRSGDAVELDNALNQLRSFASEFGLTPSSRAKVTAMPASEKEEDALEKYLQRASKKAQKDS